MSLLLLLLFVRTFSELKSKSKLDDFDWKNNIYMSELLSFTDLDIIALQIRNMTHFYSFYKLQSVSSL